jgi:rubrerythrin
MGKFRPLRAKTEDGVKGLTEGSQTGSSATAGYVTFVFAGADAVGDYVCSECNYGVSVQQRLPPCPMCGGQAWEPVLRRGLQLQ